MLNSENIRELVKQTYVVHVLQTFGDEGRAALDRLHDGIVQFYSFCPPDLLNHPLTICSPLRATPNDPLSAKFGTPIFCASAKLAAIEVEKNTATSGCFVELCTDGTFRVISMTDAEIDFDEFGGCSIIYRFENDTDRVMFEGYDAFIPKVHSSLKSSFARPTYSSLEEVFASYNETAADCQCRILASVWEGNVDGPRLVLVNRPEAIMRNSLSQALSMMLGGEASVRPEQNVDELKPVDIRVEWHGSDASALIEIKWVGRSTAKPTTDAGSPFRDYGVARAREGSKQLADYMDRNLKSDRRIKPKGYHVVFDARRNNVGGPTDRVTKTDGLHYALEEIDYDPNHFEIRDDFGPYVRFFLRPRESYFKAA